MQHIIIGAGPCGVVAAETLRKASPSAEITLIGDEPEPPYSRMAIPYFLSGKIGTEGTYLRPDNRHQNLRIDYLNQRVTSIDALAHDITLENGQKRHYDKLLIATGSHPVPPPIEGMDLPDVFSCWTLEDARQIAARAQAKSRVTLIGAGFIACIILESLVLRGVTLNLIEMGDRMVPRMMDETAGGLLKQWCIKQGVNVLTSTRVTAIRDNGNAMMLSLDNGEDVPADLVITATGVKPNLAFLKGSGIETDDGIIVNNRLQTNHPHIYAAGDVAQGRDFSTGKLTVQAIQPTATEHGHIAALNMAGNPVEHHGSINMNVLDTLGLISHSFGLWMGVEGGDHVERHNPETWQYINLRFGVGQAEDILIGASTLGITQHIGVIRGLIESQVHLKAWKERLIHDPTRLMEAYLASTQVLENPV